MIYSVPDLCQGVNITQEIMLPFVPQLGIEVNKKGVNTTTPSWMDNFKPSWMDNVKKQLENSFEFIDIDMI